jgi:Arc/MetJ-type ribon-helix-helix transcriptional regulator
LEEKSEKLTIRLPARFVKALDFLVAVDDFPSRSEAIRAAVRDLVYSRIEMVPEKVKRIHEAEVALAEAESLRKEVLRR